MEKEKWEIAVQDAYLYEVGEEYSEQNVKDYGLYGRLSLIDENEKEWIISHDIEMEGNWICRVKKEKLSNGRYDMEATERLK